MSEFGDRARTVVKEEITLEKFEGDILVERIYITDGHIDKVEKFVDGELVGD